MCILNPHLVTLLHSQIHTVVMPFKQLLPHPTTRWTSVTVGMLSGRRRPWVDLADDACCSRPPSRLTLISVLAAREAAWRTSPRFPNGQPRS